MTTAETIRMPPRNPPSQGAIDESYRRCTALARHAARNFYYSFWVLPADKRRAMCALYAFFRHTDDLGDCDRPTAERRTALANWRSDLRRAIDGATDDPLLPAVVDAVRRYAIPVEYLETAVDGVESDLDRSRFATVAELEHYCYQVASVVGLACIHVWGFDPRPEAYEAARRCGLAFQLTNILRDVREDAEHGRVYLPAEDLDRFGLTAEDVASPQPNARVLELIRCEAERAEEHYRAACGLFAYLSPDGRRTYGAMYDIYHALLVKIRDRGGDVFSSRVRLSGWHKATLALRQWTPLARRAP